MLILLTGAFGNVGKSTLRELIKQGYYVRIFDLPTRKNKRLLKRKPFKGNLEVIWGDLRSLQDVEQAVQNVDVIIHTAAIIPPLADKAPKLAKAVNVGGTRNLIQAAEKIVPGAKLIYTSSISVYGDRRENPFISVSDEPSPSAHDYYAQTKLTCERLIRASSLSWSIFRLTYITNIDKLQLDPLMYEMPLETCIEIADTKDVGLALANAVVNEEILYDTFNIAGGESCRTTFGDYLMHMLKIFGLGKNPLPAEAFSHHDFHCGWMDTTRSQQLLQYQRTTLESYYREVKQRKWFLRWLATLSRPLVRRMILKRSPYSSNLNKNRRTWTSIRQYLQQFARLRVKRYRQTPVQKKQGQKKSI